MVVAAFGIEWGKALKWWSGGAAPHESLRNLGFMLAGFIGIALATWRSTVAAAQANTAQQGHITDRYSKAVEHLGSDNVSIRIGGVFALKRIAEDSLERDHIAVMDVLTNFIRQHPYAKHQRDAAQRAKIIESEFINRVTGTSLKEALHPDSGNTPKPVQNPMFIDCPDIIAAIDTIRTRSDDQKAVEAKRKYTPTLKDADFSYLILNDVDLSNFDLQGVYLKDSNLLGINLSNTNLSGFDLQAADLTGAILSGVDLSDAELCSTIFLGAILDNANLTDTDLTDADLTNADLTNADLTSANVTEAEFQQIKGHPDLSKAFTRPGQPPRNLPNGVDPPPERD